MGLDGLDARCAEYYKAGARFCKWRGVVSIPAGPSVIAVRDCAYGLARYAAIAQSAGLVPIVEPEVLLDGDHDISRTLEVAENVWAETFKYLADNKVGSKVDTNSSVCLSVMAMHVGTNSHWSNHACNLKMLMLLLLGAVRGHPAEARHGHPRC